MAKKTKTNERESSPLVTYEYTIGDGRFFNVSHRGITTSIHGYAQKGNPQISGDIAVGQMGYFADRYEAETEANLKKKSITDIVKSTIDDPQILGKFRELFDRNEKHPHYISDIGKLNPLELYRTIDLLGRIFPGQIENVPPIILFKAIGELGNGPSKVIIKGLYDTGADEALYLMDGLNHFVNKFTLLDDDNQQQETEIFCGSPDANLPINCNVKKLSECLEEIGGIAELNDASPITVKRMISFREKDEVYDVVSLQWLGKSDSQKVFNDWKDAKKTGNDKFYDAVRKHDTAKEKYEKKLEALLTSRISKKNNLEEHLNELKRARKAQNTEGKKYNKLKSKLAWSLASLGI